VGEKKQHVRMINNELTKNLLRGRKCKTCQRRQNSTTFHNHRNIHLFCELENSKPEFGVCSQWKMEWFDKHAKERKHIQKVAEKRKAKREAKTKEKN